MEKFLKVNVKLQTTGFTTPQRGTDTPSPVSLGSSMSQLSATLSQDAAPDFYVIARAIQATAMLQATTSHSQWIEGLKLGSVFKKRSSVAEQYEFLRAANSGDTKAMNNMQLPWTVRGTSSAPPGDIVLSQN